MDTQPAYELSRTESLALMATEPYGRLILVRGGLPVVVPVNFVLDASGIVVRTSQDSVAAGSPESTAVGFSVDCIDRASRRGWSVTVVGRARRPQDEVEGARLAELPLQPWVAGVRDEFLVVEVGLVSGRRIGGPEPLHAPMAEQAQKPVLRGPSTLPQVRAPA